MGSFRKIYKTLTSEVALRPPAFKPETSAGAGLSRRELLCGIAGLSAGAAALPNPNAAHADTETVPASAATPVRAHKSPPQSPQYDYQVHINQVGFLPHEPKSAVIAASGPVPGGSFCIITDEVIPRVHFQGELRPPERSARGAHPDDTRYLVARFDRLQRHGRYRLRLSNGKLSPPFTIGYDIYAKLAPLSLEYFDIQRCGVQTSNLREKCHMDDGVIVNGDRSGESFDGSGGWHDAGDYMKFVETTSYVTALMLHAYQRHGELFKLSEEPGQIPALLQSATVGVEWLLKMHPSPTEFYYQIGDSSDHDEWRLPEEDSSKYNADWRPRPVFSGTGANLAGRTAAAFALAAEIFSDSAPRYAQRCLTSAKSAFELGLQNPVVVSTAPSEFYPEKTWADDMEWGAAILYRATRNPKYLEHGIRLSYVCGASHNQTSVYNTHAFAHSALYPLVGPSDRERLLGYLHTDAECAHKSTTEPFGLGTPYIWGTAEAAAGAALNCQIFAELSHDDSYLNIARRQRDYILGCNPFGICCVIGAGTRYPLYPHHQIANIRNVELSGALVGGPTSQSIFEGEKIPLERPEFTTQLTGPAVRDERRDNDCVYHDSVQDYVSNEPANDYTAKFMLMAAFYDGLS